MCTSAVPDLLTFLCSVFIHMFLLCCSKTYFYALCFCIMTHKWPWKSMGESLYWHHHKDKCFLHSGWEILSKQLPACVLKQRKKRDDGIWAVAATLIHGSFPTGRRVARCLCVFFFFSVSTFTFQLHHLLAMLFYKLILESQFLNSNPLPLLSSHLVKPKIIK